MGDRFYAPVPPENGRIRLPAAEAHHLTRVLRLGPGAVVECFNGQGQAWTARVDATGKDWADLEIQEELPSPENELKVRLTLATAIPKGDRIDWLIEKATEIGVDRLVPLRTARSVVDPSRAKLDRLRQRVVEACKQSGRNSLMRLDEPIDWATFLDREQAGWIACPEAEPIAMATATVFGTPMATSTATLAVGPEGGFAASEVAAARAIGWRPIGLGPHVLRVETAGLVGSALLLQGRPLLDHPA